MQRLKYVAPLKIWWMICNFLGIYSMSSVHSYVHGSLQVTNYCLYFKHLRICRIFLALFCEQEAIHLGVNWFQNLWNLWYCDRRQCKLKHPSIVLVMAQCCMHSLPSMLWHCHRQSGTQGIIASAHWQLLSSVVSSKRNDTKHITLSWPWFRRDQSISYPQLCSYKHYYYYIWSNSLVSAVL